MCHILHCKSLAKEEACNVYFVVIETHVFLVIYTTVFWIYIYHMLLIHQSTSVCNLQPHDYDYHDVFKVTYKPYGAGWLCTVLSFCTCNLVTGHYDKDIVMLCYVTTCLFLCCVHFLSPLVISAHALVQNKVNWGPRHWSLSIFKEIVKLYYHCYIFIFTNPIKCLL